MKKNWWIIFLIIVVLILASFYVLTSRSVGLSPLFGAKKVCGDDSDGDGCGSKGSCPTGMICKKDGRECPSPGGTVPAWACVGSSDS